MADTTEGLSQEEKQTPTQEPQLSEVELKASEEGWVPKDKWEGDPAEWRDAQTFVDRGQLFKKIEEQNRTIKDFKKALTDLQSHHSRVREQEYARALNALKQQKLTALEEGDARQVVQIDDQIDLVKDEQRRLKEQPAQQTNEPPQEFVQWNARNKWYSTDEDARAYADGVGNQLANKGLAPEEVLKEVEQRVKKTFPHLFRNPNKDKVAAVENSTTSTKSTESGFQLSDDERRVMQRFIRTIPGFDEKQYIKELKEFNKRKGV